VEAASGIHAGGRAARECDDIVDAGDVPVRIDRALAIDDADAGALIDAGDRVFDATVVEHELQSLVPFPEELREVAATRERGTQRALGVTR
jgi:hypothetical protein